VAAATAVTAAAIASAATPVKTAAPGISPAVVAAAVASAVMVAAAIRNTMMVMRPGVGRGRIGITGTEPGPKPPPGIIAAAICPAMP